jgi:hypothetical protein
MPKTEEEIDRYIASLTGSMAISGLTLSDDDIADCRAILRGEKEGKEALDQLLKQFQAAEQDATQ